MSWQVTMSIAQVPMASSALVTGGIISTAADQPSMQIAPRFTKPPITIIGQQLMSSGTRVVPDCCTSISD
jgi:hypothetical protein